MQEQPQLYWTGFKKNFAEVDLRIDMQPDSPSPAGTSHFQSSEPELANLLARIEIKFFDPL